MLRVVPLLCAEKDMSEPNVYTLPTGETLVFVGLLLQAAAVFWIWRDWQMSQYQHPDWRKAHRESESATIEAIVGFWSKFGGKKSEESIDWHAADSEFLENMSKEFPASGDGDELIRRKVDALTPRYGIGPSIDELQKVRRHIEHLALIRRGVPDYRTFVRKKTFGTALRLMLAGFVFQLIGSWPTQWVAHYQSPPSEQTQK